ncbi:hypothetical protein BO71DRAFT_284550, partial [Aspergillus ellipticus CBS 707.79]
LKTSVKIEVKRLSGHVCWVCKSYDPWIADVVPLEDTQAPLWFQEGVFNFSLKSAANGIPLCPNCYRQFGLAEDPGLVIIPTDLQYFIDFEVENSKKRLLAANEGKFLPRRVPTAAMYRDHLVKRGIISDEATSGTYQSIFLKKHWFIDAFIPEKHGFTNPKHWHGAPLATLRRGILTLGSGRIYSIDPTIVKNLTTLRDLYFEPTTAKESLSNLKRKKEQADDGEDESNE